MTQVSTAIYSGHLIPFQVLSKLRLARSFENICKSIIQSSTYLYPQPHKRDNTFKGNISKAVEA